MVVIMKDRHRCPRIIFALKSIALVLTLTSVFLVGGEKAHALEDTKVQLFAEQAPTSPLEENNDRIKQIKEDFEVKASLIEQKRIELELEQIRIRSVEEAKQTVANEVDGLKSEVEVLQAKLAEKKRLEALRIMPETRFAPDSLGNLYAEGNCTYYVKNRRPDLSNGLGNANTWYIRAAAMGYSTGAIAKTGAVGVDTSGWLGHVVFVEQAWPDGRILISEMNINGLWSTRTREANESDFVYIYELP